MRRPDVVRALAMVALCCAAGTAGAQAQAPPHSTAAVVQAARAYTDSHGHEVLSELFELLAVPNLASDSVAIRRNADLLVRMLARRGIQARLLDGNGPPVVFGELRTPGATRTITFYSHYDGQAVVPEEWATPPWEPVLRAGSLGDGAPVVEIPRGRAPDDWRIYARSASDDKSPIVAVLAAVDALRAGGIEPAVNLRFFFEGEEEAGSPNLRRTLELNRELLASDAWIIADGPVHQSGLPMVVFGARGVMGLELTVYGASRPLHSGHYGNWAPNPGAVIADLVASMRSADGEVKIAGFDDGVRAPTAAEVAAADSLARFDAEIRRSLLLAGTEADDAPLPLRILRPALNVRGIQAGNVAELATNAIPTEAKASFDIRLVPGQNPEHVRDAVERHIAAQGFTIVRAEPDTATRLTNRKVVRVHWQYGYPALRTDMELPLSRRVVELMHEATGAEVLVAPISGGTLPLFPIREVLGVPLILVPMVNADNNQHAANENLRVGNLWMGVEIYAALIAGLGRD